MEFSERTIRRGQVYWIDNDDVDEDTITHVVRKKRPGVIMSSSIGCSTSPIVTIVYLTSQERDQVDIHPDIYSTGRKSYALCEMVETIEKSRLLEFKATLTDFEMEKIERGIQVALGMSPSSGSQAKEIRDLKQEKMSLEAEVTMWRRLYEKTMDSLVDVKFNTDLASRSAKREMPKIKMVPDEPEYNAELTEPTVQSNRVNINTASAVEINEAIGLSLHVCYGITGYRKKIGAYRSVEEILDAPRVTEYHLKKYGDRMAV